VNRAASRRQKPTVVDQVAVVSAAGTSLRYETLLRETVALERGVAYRRELQVHAAREAGSSWTELGKILGVSPQAVQQRYGRVGGLDGRLVARQKPAVAG
jgi:hypothetical protein